MSRAKYGKGGGSCTGTATTLETQLAHAAGVLVRVFPGGLGGFQGPRLQGVPMKALVREVARMLEKRQSL
jgi:hypothetical protein